MTMSGSRRLAQQLAVDFHHHAEYFVETVLGGDRIDRHGDGGAGAFGQFGDKFPVIAGDLEDESAAMKIEQPLPAFDPARPHLVDGGAGYRARRDVDAAAKIERRAVVLALASPPDPAMQTFGAGEGGPVPIPDDQGDDMAPEAWH